MKKTYGENLQKTYKKTLLEDLEMSLLNFNLIMICILHKMLVFVKNQPELLKDDTWVYNKGKLKYWRRKYN